MSPGFRRVLEAVAGHPDHPSTSDRTKQLYFAQWKYEVQCSRLGLPYQKEVTDAAYRLACAGANQRLVIDALESLIAYQAANKDMLIEFNHVLALAREADDLNRRNDERARAEKAAMKARQRVGRVKANPLVSGSHERSI